ncbi:flagellin [Thalassospira profundimaris]|uniref:flagellin N-terminal helical domain-containing protein n=1 Tax=Thalassospira profundimaris TaxID=502049 RepID=UPI0002872975|nr:flagellin [Thalassospira profundimaris]EKF08540.1 flagellar hook-associated protein FlgL [Thalassospira profundimaris WP0211]
MVTRVATYTNHTLLSDLALRNAARVTDLQNQASSGYKSRNYAGIADSTQRLLNLETEYSRTEQYLRNTTQGKLRLQSMETAVDSMLTIATEMKSLLIQASSAQQADDVNIRNEADQALQQIANLLNTNLDGRFLFAGGRSEEPAVDIEKIGAPDNYISKLNTSVTSGALLSSLGVTTNGTLQIVSTDVDGNSSTSTVTYNAATDDIDDIMDAINNVTTNRAIASLRGLGGEGTTLLNIENVGNGSITITETGGGDFLSKLGMEKMGNPRPDADYYMGDHQIMDLRVDDKYDVSYGILGDNPAFQKLIQGLGIAASTENQDALTVALGFINDAINELPNVQGQIGLDIANVERFEERHQDFKVFAAQAITDIETVDVPLTLAEVSQYTTALQASFISISRAADLSLANYLR